MPIVAKTGKIERGWSSDDSGRPNFLALSGWLYSSRNAKDIFPLPAKASFQGCKAVVSSLSSQKPRASETTALHPWKETVFDGKEKYLSYL